MTTRSDRPMRKSSVIFLSTRSTDSAVSGSGSALIGPIDFVNLQMHADDPSLAHRNLLSTVSAYI